jgi:hypothetical protein
MITYRHEYGPGGQKKNKTSSAVRLIHKPTLIQASASEDRMQSINKQRALRRLRMELAIELRQRESAWAKAWGMNSKNMDLPLLAGCILDSLYTRSFQVSEVAKYFSLRTSRLIKILQKSDRLWREVNAQRQHLNLKELR